MHDPLTVAFEIRYPWRCYKCPKNDFEKKYRESFITIWHKDPEKDGTDDSCGWFMRSRHGNKETLKKIEKAFSVEWDSTFQSENPSHVYNTGWFTPEGNPNITLQGIVINMFNRAAFVVFNSDWKKTNKYMKEHLFDILMFADNNVDSLNKSINRIFEKACNEEYNKEESIKNFASIIYGCILRDIRPWYKHPRWHIWHWKIQIHPLRQTF